MNAHAAFFRIATFHARRGCADRLAEQLLQAATLVAEAARMRALARSSRP